MKYWTHERIQKRALAEKSRKSRTAARKSRLYAQSPEGQLDALGLPIRRKILVRLKSGGAMSVSKLAATFRMKLPTAMLHVSVLEQSGFVTTHKRGRIRICIYNKDGFKDLCRWVARQ